MVIKGKLLKRFNQRNDLSFVQFSSFNKSSFQLPSESSKQLINQEKEKAQAF